MYQALYRKYRPQTFDDVVGQKHLISENMPLRNIIESGNLPNMIFYGPSGVGKTTVANIIAAKSGMTLRKINATNSSLSDIKEVLVETGTLFGSSGILLYIDEIQYFNQKQQQTVLEFIEDFLRDPPWDDIAGAFGAFWDSFWGKLKDSMDTTTITGGADGGFGEEGFQPYWDVIWNKLFLSHYIMHSVSEILLKF